ncbi:serine protease HtrA [Gudongella sp. SC589]|jgi:S1-C subfamily serine protease|uniref:serine protease HtrA n=1 Tax=Gudongella sp. SC589 TaxID=3385990 RepID=UPI003904D025
MDNNNNIDPEANMDQEVQNSKVVDDAQQGKTIQDKKEKKGRNWLTLVAVVLLISFVGGFAGAYLGNGYFADQDNPNDYVQTPITINPNDSITAVSAVARKSMSSVVGITTVETQEFWFSQQDVSGVGSGVIVHEDGYILTNSHVVADGEAKEITVKFEDGEQSEGEVLWNDPFLDLAVVKVERSNLPVAVLGDSDSLVVGELAVAIGNPLGLEFERTVTSGVISGLNRAVRVDASNIIEDLIQTDASINPGNSGGPLLNGNGEVIGINTAKMKTAEGLGFAIPINLTKPIIDEIVRTGTHQTVLLGITGVPLEEYEARLGIDLEPESGVVVLEVQPGSTAQDAGILPGDVIIGIDDREISNMGQLRRALYKYGSGDSAQLDIVRNGEKQTLLPEFKDAKINPETN